MVKCVIIRLKLLTTLTTFFVNVAHDLVSELPNMTDSYNCKSFYGNKGIILGMFRLQGVSRAFIVDQLKALKP